MSDTHSRSKVCFINDSNLCVDKTCSGTYFGPDPYFLPQNMIRAMIVIYMKPCVWYQVDS